MENLGFYSLGETQHVDRAMYTGLGCLYGIKLIVDRGGRACEVVYLIHFDKQREGNVMSHDLKIRIIEQGQDVTLAACEEVIDT